MHRCYMSTATIQKVTLISRTDALLSSDLIIDVVKAMDIAFKYRHYFRKDIIVDLLVYRRWYACFFL